jgi:hypothetical protein
MNHEGGTKLAAPGLPHPHRFLRREWDTYLGEVGNLNFYLELVTTGIFERSSGT